MTPILLSCDELRWLSQQALETYWMERVFDLTEFQKLQHIADLQTILSHNFTQGRWKKVIDRERFQYPNLEVARQAYAYRVAAGYEEQHMYVQALECGELQVWKELRAWLQRTAQAILCGKYNLYQTALSYEADECVQWSCEIIYTTRFPYDVVFHAWARRILENTIHQHHRQAAARRCDFFDDLATSSSLNDTRITVIQEYEIPDPRRSLEAWELTNLIIDLISRLQSKSQQEVMRLTCFYDLDDVEIARRMGKSVQAVHNLRNRARINFLHFLESHPGLLD